MKHHISWEKSGSAEIVLLTNDAVTLRSTIPSPPGSRIGGALASDAGVHVKFKVHSSRKQEDGSFLIEGRPIDLTHAVKNALLALMSKV